MKFDFDQKGRQAHFDRVNASRHAHITHILTQPTKQQLRDELAEAVRNTAKLPTQTEGESDASDH